MAEPRRFKVRGEDMVGTEVTRVGNRITLMCAPHCWPFVRERTYDREELVRLDGGNNDDEPKTPAPKVRRSATRA
jgi:hypothetical protein